MTDKLFRFLEKTIKIISVLPLLLLAILVLVFRNTVTFDVLENCCVVRNSVKFFLILPVALALFFGLVLLLRRIPEKILFWGFFLAWLAGGIYLITHINMTFRADSGICYWNAINYAQGNYSHLQFGLYFYEHPYQLGLVTYNSLLIKLSGNPDANSNFVFYVNLFWILACQFFLWRTSSLLYAEHPVLRKLIILLSFSFLPQFFYLFFAYGQVPGLACLMVAVYLTVRSIKRGNRWLMLAAMPFMAAACLLRMNYMIGGIALILVCLLYALRHKRIFFAAAAAGIAVSITVPRHFINSYYETVADTDLSHGTPYLLYVAMGLQDIEKSWGSGGWYNGFHHDVYLDTGCDTQVCREVALEAIGERLQTFCEYPSYAVKFFAGKLITTWCDPTYQSIWSGPLVPLGNTTDVKWLESLYSGGMVYRVYSFALNLLSVILFAFSTVYVLWSLIARKAFNPFELFCVLFFLGGFLFHIAWETKCQYVYPYMVFLPPIAANGVLTVRRWLKEKVLSKTHSLYKLFD